MNAWERTWFRPADPAGLLVVRTLVLLAVTVDVVLARSHFLRAADAGGGWEPVSLLALLAPGPPPTWVLDLAIAVTVAGALVAAVPDAPRRARPWLRAAAVASASSYLFLAMAANSLGKIDHDRQPLVVMAVVVACAAWPTRDAAPSWRFRWPVQAARATVAVMLTAAAWSKLTTAGPAWVTSGNLRSVLAAEVLVFRDPPLGELALWITADPWRWRAVAAAAIVGEAVAVAVLVVRRQPWRAAIALAAASTVVGITLLMGLVGFPILALLLVLGAVEELRTVASRRWWRAGLLTLAALGLAALLQLAGASPLATLPLVGAVVTAVWVCRGAGPTQPCDAGRGGEAAWTPEASSTPSSSS